MRLAYLHYLYGGDTALHHVRQFAEAARELGHRIDVHAMNLAPVDASASSRASIRTRMRQGLKRRAARYLHEPKELLWNLRYVRREIELLRRDPPDVLLVRSHVLTASCASVAAKLKLPLVLEVNEPAEESRLYSDYFHVPWLPEQLERRKLSSADAIVVVSTALKRYLIEHYTIDAANIVVSPNGADTTMFSAHTTADSGTRATLGNAPVVGFIGSFQRWHGADFLMQMTRAIAAERADVKFLFVGDGPEADEVRRAAAGELRDRLLMTGRVDHARIPALVACIDVAVMPESNFYGSPLKVIEWMAAGRAVVGPSYGPFTDVITDGVEGILFPPRDLSALVRSVLRLVDDQSLRESIGRAAAERVRRSLTWRHNAERVLDACRMAVTNHHATGDLRAS